VFDARALASLRRSATDLFVFFFVMFCFALISALFVVQWHFLKQNFRFVALCATRPIKVFVGLFVFLDFVVRRFVYLFILCLYFFLFFADQCVY
jgi:hypothetical protein